MTQTLTTWEPSAVELDREEAKKVTEQIDSILASIQTNEMSLATGYANLGMQLLKIRTEKYWIALGYRSFGAYIETIKERIDRGRTQIYQFISVAERLLPSINESQLGQIGISKALELKRFVEETGTKPPQNLIDCAMDPRITRELLKAQVFRNLHKQDDPQGIYFDLGGVYLTADEREEIKRAFDVAARVDPVIPVDWQDHQRKKEIVLRLAREFLGTWEELVQRGEA
jgi:hypothetical protein